MKLAEIEYIIKELRSIASMISYIDRTADNKFSELSFATEGTRQAMLGGLIERKNNLLERLNDMGITL